MPRNSGLNGVERLLFAILRILNVFAGGMMFLLFVLLFAQVLFRYVLTVPLFWVEESVQYLIVYIVMLGCTTAYWRHGHPKLAFIYDRFKGNALLVFECLIRIPICFLLYVFCHYGYLYALGNSWMRTSALEISFFWPFLAIPLGGAIALACLLLDTADIVLFRRSLLLNINVPDVDIFAGGQDDRCRS